MNKIRISYIEDDLIVGSVDLHEDHEITNLIVMPKDRRRGIAEMLVTLAEGAAENMGYPRVFATVTLANLPSRKLWEKRKYSQYYKYEKRL